MLCLSNCHVCVQLTTIYVHDTSVHLSFMCCTWSSQSKNKLMCNCNHLLLSWIVCGMKGWYVDVHTNQTYKMKATSVWTINDFQAYEMLSGWSMHRALSCPVFQDQTHGSSLHCSRKMGWYDCYHCFLPRHHSFSQNRNSYIKRRTVYSQPPRWLTLEKEWQRVHEFPKVSKNLRCILLDLQRASTNRQNVVFLWELPY